MKKRLFATIFLLVFCCSLVLADTPSGRVSESVNLQISLLNQDPDPAQPGRYVELRFRVENLGAYSTADTVFELVTEYPFSLDPGESPRRTLGTIYGRSIGDEAATLYYKLRVDRDAVEGDNYVRIKYSVDGGNTWVLTDQITVRVQSVYAIVGIEKVETTPSKIEPGKRAKIIVTMKNMADTLMEDVTLKLDMSSSSMPFAPVDSTSEKKVKSLASGESKDFVFDIIVLGDAEAQIYKLPIVISYVDTADRFYNKSDILALVVGATPDIETTVDEQTVYSGGKAGKVTVKFVNKGVTDIKFMNVRLMPDDGFDIISTSVVYIGDLDSDDYETAEFDIYVKSTREDHIILPLKLEYTDPNNEGFLQEVELRLNLYSGSEMKRYGFSNSNGLIGLVVIAVIVGGGYYVYRRWKKRKG